MRSFFRGCIGLVVLVAVGGCSKSDDKQPTPTGTVEKSLEDACVEIVSSTCTALAACCQPGTTFDAFECKRSRLEECLSGAAGVHEGTVRFNAGALQACPYSALASCNGTTPAQLTVEQQIACQSVMTGYRPLGSGCTSSAECAIADAGYPECVHSKDGSQGVCAKHVISADGTCGFFADAYEDRACTSNQYCDLDYSSSGSQTYSGKASFEQHGTCRSYAAEGDPCTQSGAPSSSSCAPGLVCSTTATSGQPRCVTPHALGDTCGHDAVPCAQGLQCNYAKSVCESQNAEVGSFCYVSSYGTGGAGGSSGGTCVDAQICCQKLGGGSGCSALSDPSTCNSYLQAQGSACSTTGTGGMTGTGGTTGSGGSTNGSCNAPVSGACATCVEQSCPSQAAAAFGDAWTSGVYAGACGAYLNCTCSCPSGDSACLSGCNSQLGNCSTAAQQLQTCQQQSCSAQCG